MKMLGGIVAASDEKVIAINLNSKYMPYTKNPDQWTLLSALI